MLFIMSQTRDKLHLSHFITQLNIYHLFLLPHMMPYILLIIALCTMHVIHEPSVRSSLLPVSRSLVVRATSMRKVTGSIPVGDIFFVPYSWHASYYNTKFNIYHLSLFINLFELLKCKLTDKLKLYITIILMME